MHLSSTSPIDPTLLAALFNNLEDIEKRRETASSDDAEESAEEESHHSFSARENQCHNPFTSAAPLSYSSCSVNNDESPQNPTSAEIKEVIIGSNLLETPKFHDQSFLQKHLPDCYDQTPIRRGRREKLEATPDVSSIEMDDTIFLKEFNNTYYTLAVHMNFSDDDLLKYSSSERDELAVLIDVFLKSRHRVKHTDDYQQLADQIYDRFEQTKFADYFRQDAGNFSENGK